MADTLVISEEAMENAQREYDECAQRMRTLKTKLQNAVSDVRAGWDTEAGKAFFSKFDDEWCKHLSDYIAVIEHMSGNMKDSLQKYRPLFEDADKINLQ